MRAAPRCGLLPLLTLVPLLFAACGGSGQRARDDAAFARYLEADARPSDPSAQVTFGRSKLPSDFPGGLPLPAKATLLGWTRTASATALSWEAVYSAPGDAGSVGGAIEDALAAGGWQVHDRASSHGFNALDIVGVGQNDGSSGVISVGPAPGGVQVIEEVGRDR